MIKHTIHFTDWYIDYDIELNQLLIDKNGHGIPKNTTKINETFSSMIICEKPNYGT